MNKTDLFNIIINIDEITTKKLLNNGVSTYYISKMVFGKVIKRTSKGKFEIYNINELYSYGKTLVKMERFDDAIKCFLKCLDYNKNDIRCYFQLIILNIYKDNYNDVLKYVDLLNDLGVVVDNERNYLLYLISNITNLDDCYNDEIRNISFDMIKYNNSEDRNAYNENRVRGFCFQKKFAVALSNEKRMFKVLKTSSFAFIHNLLITKAYEKDKNNKKIMYDLIQTENYHKVKEMLGAEINPSKYNVYVEKLIDEIIAINSNEQLSKTKMAQANNVFEAIDGKNYSLALALCNKYEKDSADNYNLIYLLLNNICNKIKELVNPVLEKHTSSNLNYFSEINENNYFEVEKFMNYVNKILSKKHGVYILDEFNDKTTNDLLQIIKLYPNLDAFLIDYNFETRIVIRYCPTFKENINIKSYYLYAGYCYQYGEYEECLKLCLELLQTDEPTAEFYELTAYTYLKLKNGKNACDIFMILYNMTKNIKYVDIINSINGAYFKQLFEMDENEFYLEETDTRKK